MQNQTILIIDDNEDLRSNAAELLELAGYKTTQAQNGKEGLEIARREKPNLILCDIMMPVLDGYGVLRAANNQEELKNIPFIFLTAKAEKEDFRKGMDLGADDYLSKPFEGDELLRVVEARLKKRQSYHPLSSSDLDSSLTGVPSDPISRLAAKGTIKKFRPRDIIFMEGDSSGYLYYIIKGNVKIYRINESGKEFITSMLDEGDFFGHQALLEKSPQKNWAAAVEDSEIALIPKEEFFNLIVTDPHAALSVIRIISGNCDATEASLLKVAYDSARKRVSEALLTIASKYNAEANPGKSFPAFRENISSLAGISPESVSRNLSDFKEEGLIRTENGEITILDYKKLRNLRG